MDEIFSIISERDTWQEILQTMKHDYSEAEMHDLYLKTIQPLDLQIIARASAIVGKNFSSISEVYADESLRELYHKQLNAEQERESNIQAMRLKSTPTQDLIKELQDRVNGSIIAIKSAPYGGAEKEVAELNKLLTSLSFYDNYINKNNALLNEMRESYNKMSPEEKANAEAMLQKILGEDD